MPNKKDDAVEIIDEGMPRDVTPAEYAEQTAAGPLEQWYYDSFPAELMTPEYIQGQIVESLLTISADDILDVRESLDSAGMWAWKPIVLHEIESVSPSVYGGIWVKVGVIIPDSGQKVSVAIGSPTLLAQLKVLVEAGRLPAEVKICPIRKGGREGRNPPLYFRRWDYDPNRAK